MKVLIQILGGGCANCDNLADRVEKVVTQKGLGAEIEKVTDFGTIAAMGVMQTPALVAGGEILVSGRVPSEKEIGGLLDSIFSQ